MKGVAANELDYAVVSRECQRRNHPLEMLKGTLRSFNADAYTATVQISGSLATWLEAVPVARNIAARHLTPGRTCAVVFFDAGNPEDAVVLAVYG